MRYLLLFLICAATQSPLQAQEVVVSEYRNSTDQEAEWTELLVIADDVDLRGYIITDNRGGGDRRQSGPQFKNVPLWEHVRAGTIILIHHGPTSVVPNPDVDAADGYLEISQLDLQYFDIVNVDGASASNGMNINQDRDFVQVLKPDTSHVHGLMHGRPGGETWDNTPDPKAGYDTTNIGPRSICVSGRTLAAYNAGRSNDSCSTGRYMTPGLPNRVDERKERNGLPDVNYLFWQDVREPQWSVAPTITFDAVTPTRHVISWTPQVDPYATDRTSGYLILRDTNGFASFPENAIIDGTIYPAGTTWGSVELLAVVTTADGATYTDTKDLECGLSYTYRVYAYRFGADDELGQPAPTTARGRQYSPVFAQSDRLNKPNPPKPQIQASQTQICPGDTVVFTTTSRDADEYEWTVNGAPVDVLGAYSITVTEPGTYRLTVTVEGGCQATSDAITVSLLPAITVGLSPRGTVSICNGDTVLLTADTTVSTYEWRRNGVPIPGATGKTYAATQSGRYQVLIESQSGCRGISEVTTIEIPDVQYAFEPTVVDFGVLGTCQSSTSGTVDLINEGEDAITLSQIVMPAGFALISPAPGFVVQPNERVALTLLFAPSGTGVITGQATFTATPCGVQRTLELRGERRQGEVALNKAGIDFGIFTACAPTIRAEDSITIQNTGTGPIRIGVPLVFSPFILLPDDYPDTLYPDSSFTYRIRYQPFGPDLDRGVTDVIGFPFASNSCRDTLRASLQAGTFFPRLELAESQIDLGFVLECVGYVDTVLEVRNTSPVDASITGVTSTNVSPAGLPVEIPAGESRFVSVRVTPNPGVGGFVVRDSVIGQACDQRLAVRYSGTWFAGQFTGDPSTLDLPSVSLCGGPDSSTATFTITASQTNGLRAPVTSVDVSAPFSVDLQPGTTIISDLTVTVTYRPTMAGFDTDTVVIVFGPCGDTVRTIVRGEARAAARTTSIDDADFGIIGDGQFTQRRVVITNTGGTDLPVEALEGLAGPFSVVSSTPPLPATLAPGDSVVVVLQYVYFGPDRRDTLTITSRTSGTCADAINLVLTGATVPNEPIDGIVVVIPEDLTAEIGTSVQIPVALASSEPLQGAGLSTLSVDLTYDGSIFKAVSATPAIAGVTATVTETSPGSAVLTISASELLASDPLVVISGTTYLGGARSTPLAISGVTANTGEVTGDDGLLTLTGDCAVETQVIALGAAPAMRVLSTDKDVISLEVTTLTDEPAVLQLVDLRGAVYARTSIRVRPGTHIVRMAAEGLSNGVYMVSMEHGRIHRSAPVFVTH